MCSWSDFCSPNFTTNVLLLFAFQFLGILFCSSCLRSLVILLIPRIIALLIFFYFFRYLLLGMLVHNIVLNNFFSWESILHIYKSTIRLCIDYCCHIWSFAPATNLEILDNIQRSVFNVIGPNLASYFNHFPTAMTGFSSVFPINILWLLF